MPSRNSNLPPFVYRQVVKGHTYYRFRKGGNTVRLRGEPGTAEFHTAYAKLLGDGPPAGRYDPGSVAHMIDIYERSAKFAQLSPGTQRDYKRYLARLDRSVGDKPLKEIDRQYVANLQDKLQATPSAANHAIAVISALFRFAKSRHLATDNPAEGFERLKGGDGFLRWTDEDVAAFRRSATPAMRLAMELGLYTGQRLSDVIRLAWSNYDGTRIKLRQQKTGTPLVIPVHPDLRALLDPMPRTSITILTSRSGRSFHSRVFSRDFREARIKAGLGDGLSFHGLRHTAASRLAELGAGAPEIQAITGHKSLKLVEHYIRQASQEMQADRAIARLPLNRR